MKENVCVNAMPSHAMPCHAMTFGRKRGSLHNFMQLYNFYSIMPFERLFVTGANETNSEKLTVPLKESHEFVI